MEKKIKNGLLIIITGIVVFGFNFKNANAFPAELYDAYEVEGKIKSLEVIEKETPETYGKATFTLEILKATLKFKGTRHDEIPLIKPGDVIEANSYYKFKYNQPSFISISASYYNPSEFKEGDRLRADISYAGDSTLLSDPKYVNNNYYLYTLLFGSIAILIILSTVIVVRHKRNK